MSVPMIIELNDWQLTIHTDRNAAPRLERCAASGASGSLTFGHSALTRSRTEPQQFNNRYLNGINADPLSAELGQAKNHADLLYHHLRTIIAAEESPDTPVIFGVPGHMNTDQLGLLLGIAAEAGINTYGFIDNALAHSLDLAQTLPKTYQVLDVEWHRFSLSLVDSNEAGRYVARTQPIENIGGVANFIERWMNVIADDFVQKTRFDPLHTGATEQSVYNQVIEWIERSELAPLQLSVQQTNNIREHEVGSALLQTRLWQQLEKLELNPDVPLVLTDRVASIPGLQEFFRQAATPFEVGADNCHAAYNTLAESLDGDNIYFVTQASNAAVRNAEQSSPQELATELASGGTAPSSLNGESSAQTTPEIQSESTTASMSATTATHLLANWRAYPITDRRFASTEIFRKNANSMDTTAVLQIGTEVEIDGESYIAIRLE